MKKAALYMRVSSDRQAKEGDSIPAQKEALKKYANDHGYMVAGEYIDDGVSGTKSDRDELSKLIENVKSGNVDVILVTKLDRLYRNIKHYLNMMDVLEAHNVGWIAIWEPIYDTTTPQGRLIVNQMMSIAQFEAENTGQRIRQVQAYKLSQKEVISGRTPAGYRIEEKHLVPDENAQAAIAVFQDYAECGNLNAVLRRHGGRNGIPATKPSLKRMLQNPLYIGEHNTGIKDFCPALVSADLFCEVQRALSINIKKSQKQTYLFSGLIHCAECGRTFGANTRRRKRGNSISIIHQYRCTGYYGRQPRQCHNSKLITEPVFELELIARIKPMVQDRILQYEIEQREGADRIPGQIAALESKLDRLKTLYIDGLIDLPAYKADRAALLAQVEDLQARAARRSTEDVEGLKRLLSPDLWTLYEDFSRAEKRRFWRGIIGRIEFSADRQTDIIFL